jgi:hypothetical protein
MGRPISKRYFGENAGSDGFQITGQGFFGAGPAEACYIVKQKGSKRFVIADALTGSKTAVATLTDGAPTTEGEMQILVNGTESAKKITAHKVVTFSGDVFVWDDIVDAADAVDDVVDADLGDDTDNNPEA